MASTDFVLYKTGLFVDSGCADPIGYFALTIIGYGKENNREFWVLRYSAGIGWGYHLFNTVPYVLTLVILVLTCKPGSVAAGSPGELSSIK